MLLIDPEAIAAWMADSASLLESSLPSTEGVLLLATAAVELEAEG